jgi:hypothetical protein
MFTDYYAENSCTAGLPSFLTGQTPKLLCPADRLLCPFTRLGAVTGKASWQKS